MTPFQSVFEMQRQSIEASQQLLEHGLELQGNATETFLHNSFATQRSAQDRGAQLAQEMTNTQVEASESMFEETERAIRSAMDDQFEQNAEMTQELLNDQFEQNAEMTQELLNDQFEQGADFLKALLKGQLDAFGSTLEAEHLDLRGIVDEQFGALSDSRNAAWRQFEPEFLEAVDELNERQRTLVSQSTEAFLGAHRDVEERAIEDVQQAQDAA
jgi:hypothetical protein